MVLVAGGIKAQHDHRHHNHASPDDVVEGSGESLVSIEDVSSEEATVEENDLVVVNPLAQDIPPKEIMLRRLNRTSLQQQTVLEDEDTQPSDGQSFVEHMNGLH